MDHWRRGHKQMCKKIHRGGNAEQYNADKKYKEAVAVASSARGYQARGPASLWCLAPYRTKSRQFIKDDQYVACAGTLVHSFRWRPALSSFTSRIRPVRRRPRDARRAAAGEFLSSESHTNITGSTVRPARREVVLPLGREGRGVRGAAAREVVLGRAQRQRGLDVEAVGRRRPEDRDALPRRAGLPHV